MSRVVAVRNDDENYIYLYGWGDLICYEIPDSDGFGAEICQKNGIKCPKIKLENGRIIWGCDLVWWGTPKEFSEVIKGRTLVVIE